MFHYSCNSTDISRRKKNRKRHFCNFLVFEQIYSILLLVSLLNWTTSHFKIGVSRDRDLMVVGFTTTYAISALHHWYCEFESRSGWGVQHYVIKFVSDFRQIGGFLQILRFLPPIKHTVKIWLKYCWKWC